MYTEGENLYERNKLYEEVWNAPVTKIAKSYGVSDVAIKKICKSMNIPTPPLGYWAKIKAGQKIKKEPLPKVQPGQSIKYGKRSDSETKFDSTLSFLSQKEKERLYSVALTLKVDPKKKLCKEILEYKIIVNDWNSHNKSIEGSSASYSDFKLQHIRTNYPLFAGVISKQGLKRTYIILNTIITGLRELGYHVNDDMSFCIRGEKVTFEMHESQKKTDHVLTNNEVKKLRKYENDLKFNPYFAHEPFIQKHDHSFSGRLIFRTLKNKTVVDSEKTKMEDCLSDILIQLIQQSEIERTLRLERESAERQRQEEERQRKILKRENKNIDILVKEASDYETAVKIRNYVKRVEELDINNEKVDWISWAREKADWYDPSINHCDSILGTKTREIIDISEFQDDDEDNDLDQNNFMKMMFKDMR